ncbi:hypothetical protein [Streptomyces zhihengii]|uniref:hypothetical protein n=1 Tax=Streptomyces zhihengii TaxID=1818004 RepID=UPI0033B12CCE
MASTAPWQEEAPKVLAPRVALVVSLVIAVSMGLLSGLVMVPAAEQLRSLRGGERAQGVLHKGGSCMVGHCQVAFEAGGRTVVADLPAGSGGGKHSVGTQVTVRYLADDPRTVARDADVGGGGALVLAWVSGGVALLFLVLAVVTGIVMARLRQSAPRV